MNFGNLLKAEYRKRYLIILSILAYFLSMIIVGNDEHYFIYRWIAFFLNMGSLAILFFLYLSQTYTKSHFKKLFSKEEITPIIFIAIVAIVANFLYLSVYPYVSISDELRDGGLFAMKIASGVLKNIFGYGSYDAHGLIIPTIVIPFYYLFGNSILTFRFPAALFSTFDVILLYLLIRPIVNKTAAFWSALVLATLPLQMFFAHTQIVVAFNFFWVPILLLIIATLLKRRRIIDYIFFGAVIGFVCGFHATIRAFACVLFLVLFYLEFSEMIIGEIKQKEKILTFLKRILIVICFALVGFGPRLLFTGPQDFFHTSRFVFENKVQTHQQLTTSNLPTIKANYIKSLMVYFYEPTSYFYPINKPILPPFLAIFFFLGIGYAFFILRNKLLNIFLFLLVILPFFTSAITNYVNEDNRVGPLLVLASIFVGIGIMYILSLIKNRELKVIAVAIILVYLYAQMHMFYVQRPADEKEGLKNYMSMHILYFLQNDKEYQASSATYLQYFSSSRLRTPVCVFVSPANYANFSNNGSLLDQQHFLVPMASIQFRYDLQMSDNTTAILKGDCPSKIPPMKNLHTDVINCTENNYACPVGDEGRIIIHY